jgi:hypothetical protein
MKRASVVAVCATVLVAGLAAAPFAAKFAHNSQVMVHCPNPANPGGWVTPARNTIALGDSVVWRTTGAVTDTLVITLKNAQQGWPFNGGAMAGRAAVQTGASMARGTYGYNVHFTCRTGGGGSQTVDIDPDIIIE